MQLQVAEAGGCGQNALSLRACGAELWQHRGWVARKEPRKIPGRRPWAEAALLAGPGLSWFVSGSPQLCPTRCND